MDEVEVDGLTDDPFVLGCCRADHFGGQYEGGVVVKLGFEPFLREGNAVALDAREAYFAGVALGADGLHLYGLARWQDRRDDRTGGEVEGDAEDVGVLDVEEVFLIEVVGLPAQRPADDLLAEELGAEGAGRPECG